MELDKEQEYAVASDESMIVSCGPGSGKTRILTEKARRLLSGRKNILCLCFTRSAASEMGSRVPGLPASTIHAFCNGAVGWNESWGYTGLLWRFLKDKEKPQFDWVLLDECQDVNELELDVVLTLMGDKIFAVGDPYQSIYGFQGALGPKVVGLLEAVGCKRFEVHNNYRSSVNVVDKENRVYPRRLISKGPKDVGLDSILCRTNYDVFLVSSYLKALDVPHRVRLGSQFSDVREYDVVGPSKLRVMTIHQSKGHEFDKVTLFGWKPNYSDDEERRVLYVALSRASKEFKQVYDLEKLL